MNVEARVRAAGTPAGPSTWTAALGRLVEECPPSLAGVQVEVHLGDRGVVVVRTMEPLPRESDAWWTTLVGDTDRFLRGCDAREAQILARVVAELPWHRIKPIVVRRVEGRAFGIRACGVPTEGRATPGMAPRWAEPDRVPPRITRPR